MEASTSSNVEAVSSSVDSIPPRRPPRPRINAAVILNRSPLITRTPSIFERTYYAYQARIRRALHNPFQFDFYFKQGSPLEIQFNSEECKRERKAFGAPFGNMEENLEKVKEEDTNVAIVPDSNKADQREGAGEKVMPRRHEADERNDVRSLDREGQRNLYLLLLQKDPTMQVWRFPQGIVEKGELLHHVAQRDLHKECGEHMDTWIVARNPIGVYESSGAAPTIQGRQGTLTFFFKAHILAGQVRPNTDSIQDFAWLTKEEIEGRVDADYWVGVKGMLADF